MKRTHVLALTAGLVASTGTAPAAAHARTCTHGEHWSGHGGKPLLHFVRHIDVRGRHVHVYERRTGRTWYGSYPKRAGYVLNPWC